MAYKLQCPVCSSAYESRETAHHARHPILLECCGHTCCEKCVTGGSLRGRSSDARTRVVCPICKEISEGDGKKLELDKYVLGCIAANRIQTAEKHERMFCGSSSESRHTSKSTRTGTGSCRDDQFASSSPLQPASTAATTSQQGLFGFCSECAISVGTCRCDTCDVPFCGSCFKSIHSGSRALSSHKPLDLCRSAASWQQSSLRCPIELCLSHPGKSAELYCKQDAMPVCTMCITVGDHIGHVVSNIEQHHENSLAKIEAAVIPAKAVALMLKQSLQILANGRTESTKSTSPLQSDVRNHFASIHRKLQAREVTLLKLIEKAVAEDSKSTDELIAAMTEDLFTIEDALLAVTVQNRQRLVDPAVSGVDAPNALQRLEEAAEFACCLKRELGSSSNGDAQDGSLISSSTSRRFVISYCDVYSGGTLDDVIKNYGTIKQLENSNVTRYTRTKLDIAERKKILQEDESKFVSSTYDGAHLSPQLNFCTSDTSFNPTLLEKGSRDIGVLHDNVEVSCEGQDTSFEAIPPPTAFMSPGTRGHEVKVLRRGEGLRREQQQEQTQPAPSTMDVGQAGEMVIVTHVRSPAYFVVQKVSDGCRLSLEMPLYTHWCTSPESAYAPMALDTSSGTAFTRSARHIPDTTRSLAESLSIGNLVFAQYSADGQWYRARIDSITRDRHSATVTYIDYGNTETVPLLRLRAMRHDFQLINEMAIYCGLYDLLPASTTGDWPAEATKTFASFVDNKQVHMSVKRCATSAQVASGLLQVDLLVVPGSDGRSLSVRECLVFLEHACFSSPQSRDLLSLPSKRFVTAAPLLAGDEFSAAVAFVLSPQEFYVQRTGDDDEAGLREQTHRMTDAYETSYQLETSGSGIDLCKLFYPQLGMPCAVYQENRSSESRSPRNWYRAKVVRLEPRKNVAVYFVDLGNTKVVHHTQLRLLKDEYLRLPCQALLCRLSGLQPMDGTSWSLEVVSTFVQQVRGKKGLKVKVVGTLNEGDNGRLMADVLLFDCPAVKSGGNKDGELINSWLVETGVASRTSAAPCREEGKPVKVVCVVAPDEIYVQPVEAEEGDMANLSKLLTDAPPVSGAPDDIMPGSICLVPYCVDGCPSLARARVNESQEEAGKLKVVLVDYGVSMTVTELAQVRRLPPAATLDCIAAQAMRCFLSGVQPTGGSSRWTCTACEFLIEQVTGRTCSLIVQGEKTTDGLPCDLVMNPAKVMPSLRWRHGCASSQEPTELRSVIKMLIDQGLAMSVKRATSTAVPALSSSCSSSGSTSSNKASASPEEGIISTGNGCHAVASVQPNSAEGVLSFCTAKPRPEPLASEFDREGGAVAVMPAAVRALIPPPLLPDCRRLDVRATLTEFKPPSTVYIQYDVTLASPDSFTLAIQAQQEQLRVLSHELNSIAKSLMPTGQLAVGDFCCAQFSFDECWYRAVVESVFNVGAGTSSSTLEELSICYVDYGTHETVTRDRLRQLPSAYYTLPMQSVKCTLVSESEREELVRATKDSLPIFVEFENLTDPVIVRLHIRATAAGDEAGLPVVPRGEA